MKIVFEFEGDSINSIIAQMQNEVSRLDLEVNGEKVNFAIKICDRDTNADFIRTVKQIRSIMEIPLKEAKDIAEGKLIQPSHHLEALHLAFEFRKAGVAFEEIKLR